MSIFVNDNYNGNFYYNLTDANYTEEKNITIGLTGSLIARIDMWNTAAADQLLMIAQTEQSIGGYPTNATLADSGPRTQHAFWTRLRLGHVAGFTTVTRCQHARNGSDRSQSTRHTVNSSHAKNGLGY